MYESPQWSFPVTFENIAITLRKNHIKLEYLGKLDRDLIFNPPHFKTRGLTSICESRIHSCSNFLRLVIYDLMMLRQFFVLCVRYFLLHILSYLEKINFKFSVVMNYYSSYIYQQP